MSTELEKNQQGKNKELQTEQQDTQKPNLDLLKSGPPIRVTYNGKPYNLNADDLAVDVTSVSDRELVDAVATHLSKELDKKVVLRDHSPTRLKNGYILVSPPAVYG